MKTKLDHLVVAASSLAEGVSYVKDMLGVDIPCGGEHPLMGTHNHLMQIGDGVFLEVIAQNPHAMKPQQPCWFGFDDPFVQKSLSSTPRLLTWVVNTTDIDACLRGTDMHCGQVQKLQRGQLEWFFGLPADGALHASGMFPYIIQWQTMVHPASMMKDCGCRLEKIEIYHPKKTWLRKMLLSIGFELGDKVLLHEGDVRLQATINTPSGMKVL